MVAHDQLITRYDDIGMSKRYGVGSLFNTNLPVLKGVMGPESSFEFLPYYLFALYNKIYILKHY
jgi:hypothetical protein